MIYAEIKINEVLHLHSLKYNRNHNLLHKHHITSPVQKTTFCLKYKLLLKKQHCTRITAENNACYPNPTPLHSAIELYTHLCQYPRHRYNIPFSQTPVLSSPITFPSLYLHTKSWPAHCALLLPPHLPSSPLMHTGQQPHAGSNVCSCSLQLTGLHGMYSQGGHCQKNALT